MSSVTDILPQRAHAYTDLEISQQYLSIINSSEDIETAPENASRAASFVVAAIKRVADIPSLDTPAPGYRASRRSIFPTINSQPGFGDIDITAARHIYTFATICAKYALGVINTPEVAGGYHRALSTYVDTISWQLSNNDAGYPTPEYHFSATRQTANLLSCLITRRSQEELQDSLPLCLATPLAGRLVMPLFTIPERYGKNLSRKEALQACPALQFLWADRERDGKVSSVLGSMPQLVDQKLNDMQDFQWRQTHLEGGYLRAGQTFRNVLASDFSETFAPLKTFADQYEWRQNLVVDQSVLEL